MFVVEISQRGKTGGREPGDYTFIVTPGVLSGVGGQMGESGTTLETLRR